jgi:hypothetical protein
MYPWRSSIGRISSAIEVALALVEEQTKKESSGAINYNM